MIGFIKLHDRKGATEVRINVQHIVFVRDLRSDPITYTLDGWHYTIIQTTNGSVEVKETEQEVFNLISEEYESK